jgi:hypothetical protein
MKKTPTFFQVQKFSSFGRNQTSSALKMFELKASCSTKVPVSLQPTRGEPLTKIDLVDVSLYRPGYASHMRVVKHAVDTEMTLAYIASITPKRHSSSFETLF